MRKTYAVMMDALLKKASSLSCKPCFLYIVFALLFALLFTHLLGAHYVQNYSDPVGFLNLSASWARGEGTSDRPFMYPMILHGITRLVGPDWVFVSNIPFLLLMFAMLAWLAALTVRSGNRSSEGLVVGHGYSALTAIVAVSVLIVVRGPQIRQLINPFREPLTFSLMLLGCVAVLLGWRRKNMWVMLLAGLLLGLSTSIRETSLLLALPILLWMIGMMLAERRIPWLLLICLAGGGVLGLGPLLYDNLQHSGDLLVPAYSAGRVETYLGTGSWDIPIPGMSIHNFSRQFPISIENWLNEFGFWGVFFVVGVIRAVKDRHRIILLIMLPSAVGYFVFYSFYVRHMKRYFLVSDLFSSIVIAYGVASCCCWLSRFIARRKDGMGECLPQLVSCIALLWLTSLLLPPVFRDSGRQKVWHLATMRTELLDHIELPATFMGHWHFTRRMRWLIDQDGENTRGYEWMRNVQRDPNHHEILEDRLSDLGAKTVAEFAQGKYYINEASSFLLAANWLEKTPVFSFDELSVPFERYGRSELGNLNRVGLWQNRELVIRDDNPRPRQALLMLDLKRPWDYSARSFLTGTEETNGPTYDLTNGVQFVELESTGLDVEKPFEFLIQSDSPLPPEVYWRIIGLNETIKVSYGLAAKHWAWNLTSENLSPRGPIPSDCCRVYDSGTLLIPVFAEKGRPVSAEFRVEFYRNDPYWEQRTHVIELESPVKKTSAELPQRRRQGRIPIFLGYGTGSLQMIPVHIRTSLPSHEEQKDLSVKAGVKGSAYVKLFDTQTVSGQFPENYPVHLGVGDPPDASVIVDGFYDREKSGAYTGRWTDGHGQLHTMLPKGGGEAVVQWRILPNIPESVKPHPVFSVNGREVSRDDVQVDLADDLWTYSFVVAADWLQYSSPNVLSVATTTWCPDEKFGTGDKRQLGVFVESVRIDSHLGP